MCPRNTYPFYTVTYYIDWVPGTWTYSKCLNLNLLWSRYCWFCWNMSKKFIMSYQCFESLRHHHLRTFTGTQCIHLLIPRRFTVIIPFPTYYIHMEFSWQEIQVSLQRWFQPGLRIRIQPSRKTKEPFPPLRKALFFCLKIVGKSQTKGTAKNGLKNGH